MVSSVGFVLVAGVLCGSVVVGRTVEGVGTTEDIDSPAEFNYTEYVELPETNYTVEYVPFDDSCYRSFSDCTNRDRDWEKLKPYTESPDGRLKFLDVFFSRICQYSSDIGSCYAEMNSTCRSEYPQVFSRFQTISPILCRYKGALGTLVSCMNEKEFQGAIQLIAQYKEPNSEDCGVIRNKLSRVLLLVKGRCDVRGYENLVAALRDLGTDIIAVVGEILNLDTEVSCTIDVDVLIQKQKKRSWFQPIVGA